MGSSKTLPRGHWQRAWAAAACALALVAGCGGGGQVEEFEPSRVLAFGDELSVLTAEGRRYGINAVDEDDATKLICENNPIWVQRLALDFGLVFPQCNPDAFEAPRSRILAANGAKSADLKAQVDTFLQTDSFGVDDLATMMVGQNDVFELYAQFPGRSEADITADVEARGKVWGEQINRVALAGAAVLVATMPDISLSPFAIAEKAAHTDTDRQALIRRLLDAYNNAMRLEIINDGRLIGLVFGDLETQNMVRFPGSFGLINVTVPACLDSAVLPDCTSATLVEDATSGNWLWADDTRLGSAFQQRMSSVAINRARNSPF